MGVVTEVMMLAAVAGVTTLLVRFIRNYMHFRKLELAIPGPPTLPLLGNAVELAKTTPDTVLQTILRLIGNRRELTRMTVVNHMIVFVSDPAEIEELVRRKEFNDKSVLVYSLLHVVAKRGLIQLSGAEWKGHRKWLAPGFNKNVLDRFVDVFSEEASGFVDRVEANKKCEVVENLRRAVMRNFLRTSLDDDISSYEPVLWDIIGFLDTFLRSIILRSFNPLLWWDKIFNYSATGKEVQRMKVVIENITAKLIRQIRAENNNHKSYFENERKTLMEIVCNEPAGGVQMPEEDVLDEVKTFFGANVETTVSAECWLLKVLSMVPDVQERAHQEVLDVFGDSDRPVTSDDLPKLKYLKRVVKETMRMFPPIPLVGRQCYTETELCGRTIPAGSTILLNIVGAHRDPKYWDEPDRFDPDRFLPENSKGRHPCAYIPFSTGTRNCIGGTYAMMNLTTFLATTLRAFKVLPVDDHKDLKSLYDNMSFDLSSRLVGGVQVKFARRGAMGA